MISVLGMRIGPLSHAEARELKAKEQLGQLTPIWPVTRRREPSRVAQERPGGPCRHPLVSAAKDRSMASVLSLPRRVPLVGLLAAIGVLPAVDMPSGLPSGDFSFIGDVAMEGGVIVARRGFVGRKGDWTIAADAARYDQRRGQIYAKGRVVLVLPGVRIHAERLGIDKTTETGDAWNVEVFIERDGRHFNLTAKRCHFDRRNVVLEDVAGDGGHGSILGMRAAKAHVHLREKPAEDRSGIARQVEGVSVSHVRGEMMGVPVLYVPYLYRDFLIDYPWTRYEVGAGKRTGTYVHAWIGSGLPEVFGWRPDVEVRGDAHSRNGEALGLRSYWQRKDVGSGEIAWYRMPHEQVRDPFDVDAELPGTRGSRVLDIEQRLHGAIDGFGAGAVSARWVSLPAADVPGITNLGPGPDERFRGDFLYDALSDRPLARRGLTATWGWPVGTLTLDTERHAQDGMPTTERWWGVEATLPNTGIVGPVFVDGSLWTERLLRRPLATPDHAVLTAATRTSFDGAVGVMQWFGAFGADAAAGLRGLNYQDGTIADVDVPDDHTRYIPYGTAGLRLRLVEDFAGGWQHAVTPRVGVQAMGVGRGDVLPAYGFGDRRDILEEDRRYGVGELSTEVTRSGAALFIGTLVSRWALRDGERTYIDESGATVVNRHRLVDVTAYAQGSPAADLTLTGQAWYDALRATWASLDASAQWRATRWSMFRYGGTLLPPDPYRGPVWQHRPGVSLLANRYRYDFDWMVQPGGAAVEQWHLQLTRRMVDGEVYFFGDFIRNDDGSVYDKRVGVGFSMTLGSQDPSVNPERGGRGAAFRPRSSL